jgi:hypothetical protein
MRITRQGNTVTATMTDNELVRLCICLDAAERNYRGVPHGIASPASVQALLASIESLREVLEAGI